MREDLHEHLERQTFFHQYAFVSQIWLGVVQMRSLLAFLFLIWFDSSALFYAYLNIPLIRFCLHKQARSSFPLLEFEALDELRK